MSNIPPDVLEIILNELAAINTHALTSCALVCRFFLHCARKHLFSTIHLGSPRIHSAKCIRDHHASQKFLNLTKADPLLTSYIHSFIIDFAEYRSSCLPDNQSSIDIYNLLASFTSLQELGFGSHYARPQDDWLLLPQLTKESITTSLYQLNSLHIFKVKNLPIEVFSLCTNLKVLSLEKVSLSHHVQIQAKRPPLSLHSLTFYKSTPLLEHLLDAHLLDLTNLRILDCYIDNADDVNLVSNITQLSSYSLSVFKCKSHFSPSLPRTINFTKDAPHLRSIHLILEPSFEVDNQDQSQGGGFPFALCSFLDCTLPPTEIDSLNNIQHINLQLEANFSWSLRHGFLAPRASWVELNSLLSSPRYNNMKSFSMTIGIEKTKRITTNPTTGNVRPEGRELSVERWNADKFTRFIKYLVPCVYGSTKVKSSLLIL